MTFSDPSSHQVIQHLKYGASQSERLSPSDTMFAQTGRRLYLLGDIDGHFRPRSNPYDLHSLGRPHPDDPLAEKLQGVWAQPVKGLTRYGYILELNGQAWRLDDAESFTQAFAFVEFQHRRGDLLASRQDFVALDLPLLFSTLTLANEGVRTLDVALIFEAQFDLQDAWFTSLASQRNRGQSLTVEQGRLVARADVLPEQWAVVVGSLEAPVQAQVSNLDTGQLHFRFHLKPGETGQVVLAVAIESQGGSSAALELVNSNLPQHEQILAEKINQYARLRETTPHLECPDPQLQGAFDLAYANLQMLEAETAGLGRHFYAGLEMFPFWFSCDGAYSQTGLLAGGFIESALHHTRIGAEYLGEGRVPHQISPSGKLAFAGNAQETPQWILSIWDAYRWTGNRDFLKELYPVAVNAMLEYVLKAIDPDGDGYPSGPGMVEVEGMGEEKLDTAAYTWAALQALTMIAEELDDLPHATLFRERAKTMDIRFDADWWDEESGTYAMSLEGPTNTRRPVPHWGVIVPLEVGLASAEHAAVTMATLRQHYLNRWGLKHTVGEDERVWTLPTGTLSRAAYRYGENELGEAMLRCLAETLQAGPIGLFHELIPQGACIVQLWSAAVFIRGIIEDMLGIEVHAARHSVSIKPRLPADWPSAGLHNLRFGNHIIRVAFMSEQVVVTHQSGHVPLQVKVTWRHTGASNATLESGQVVSFSPGREAI